MKVATEYSRVEGMQTKGCEASLPFVRINKRQSVDQRRGNLSSCRNERMVYQSSAVYQGSNIMYQGMGYRVSTFYAT